MAFPYGAKRGLVISYTYNIIKNIRMKKIFQLTALLMLCFLGACSEDGLDGLSGKYDMERRVYKNIVAQSTDKLRKGVETALTLSC